jgi:hypothetical protein
MDLDTDEIISATYIFADTVPDEPSALPISLVDDIGKTGKEDEIKR